MAMCRARKHMADGNIECHLKLRRYHHLCKAGKRPFALNVDLHRDGLQSEMHRRRFFLDISYTVDIDVHHQAFMSR